MRTLLIGITAALLSAPALAGFGVNVGDELYLKDWKNGQPGGAYLAKARGTSSFADFYTFCVEVEEEVWVNGNKNQHYVVIDDIGLQTVSANKTLGDMTAWLFTQFDDGTLSSYSDSVSDRNALQYGIWKGMGYTNAELAAEINGGASKVSQIEALWNAKSWAADFAASGWTGYGDVRIANIVYGTNKGGHSAGDGAQDLLIRVDLPTPPVPVPGAVLLGMVGLALTGMASRRQA